MATKFVNCTPHVLVFKYLNGHEKTVNPSGFTLEAKAQETLSRFTGDKNEISLVNARFVPTSKGLAELLALEDNNPGALIIGSIISAQAYPGRVVSPMMLPGFERVSPDQKRCDPFKFTTF